MLAELGIEGEEAAAAQKGKYRSPLAILSYRFSCDLLAELGSEGEAVAAAAIEPVHTQPLAACVYNGFSFLMNAHVLAMLGRHRGLGSRCRQQ